MALTDPREQLTTAADQEELLAGDSDTPEPAAKPQLAASWRLLLYGGATALAVLAVLETGLAVSDSDDFWWGMAAGRYITDQLEVPQVDVFSHTFAGRPWINPEWLTHVLFYNVYNGLGENWIVYLRIGLVVSIFSIALGMCLDRSKSWLISLLVVAAGAWVCRPFLDARPQMFTFLYSILLLYLLHLFRRRDRNLLYLIPFVFLVWTQQHGGYFFGFLVLLGNIFAESGKRLLKLPADPLPWSGIRMLAVVTLFSALAMLINPWTHEAFTHPLEMSKLVSGSNVFLSVTREWLPPRLFITEPFNPSQFWLFLFFAAVVILPIAIVRWRAFDLNDVGLAAVLVFAFALQHRRFIPLFAILTMPLMSYAVKLWIDWWHYGRGAPARWSPGATVPAGIRKILRQRAKVVAALAWLLLIGLLPIRALHLREKYSTFIHDRFPGNTLFRANTHQVYYPEQAVRLLRQVGTAGLMFNLYNWGGYLEYFLPEHKTFTDGRAQTVFDEAFHHRYLTVRTGSPGWKAVLEQYDISFALLHTEINAVLLEAMDQDAEWQCILGHDSSRLLVRRDGKNRRLLERFQTRELPLPETGMTYFIYGLQADEDGNHEQAIEDYRRAAELSPGNERFRAHWIIALSSRGRSEEARRHVQAALEDLPESPWVRLAAARLQAEAGNRQEAHRLFDEIFRRWPERVEAVDGMLKTDLERARSSIAEVYRDAHQAPWRSYAMGRLAEFEDSSGDARRFYNAEGLAAELVGDQMRLLRSQQATDRILGQPQADGDIEAR